MTRSELIARVAARSSLSKTEAVAALDALTSTIANALAERETVTVAGFGKFEARSRAARQGRNPRTGAPVDVPAARVPSFKAAKALRDALNPCEPSPVDSNPDLVPAARTRHSSAFATAPRRQATAAMRQCPTRDRVTFVPERAILHFIQVSDLSVEDQRMTTKTEFRQQLGLLILDKLVFAGIIGGALANGAFAYPLQARFLPKR